MALGWRKEYLRYKGFFLNIVSLYKQKEDLRAFLEILLSLATVSFFGILALKPTFLTIAELFQEIKTKEELIVQMDTKIANLENAQIVLTQEASRLPTVKSAIPSSPKPELFVYQIEKLAATDSVTILGATVGELTLKGKVETPKASKEIVALPEEALGMGFSLSVAGDYQNLFLFLKDLERLRFPIRVDSLAFNLSKFEEKSALSMIISGRTPYLGNK